jgi:hypothetical protein
MKKIISIFLIVVTLILSSCSESVNYTVDKKHEPKMKTIQKMVLALVENDSDSYLGCFEPSYIENIKKSIDTLGTQYYGAENFDDFIKTIFVKTKDDMNINYGDDITVDLSFDSVNDYVITETGLFTDDYSIGYTLPLDNIKASVKVETKMVIKGSESSKTNVGTFVLLQLNDDKWYIHPESFLFTI